MSHRALIAERQRNDRFNVYFSRNGAEDIHLLDELRESLNVHGRIDWESLTGSPAPEAARRLADTSGSECDARVADFSSVVDHRPLAVNIPQEELLGVSDLLRFEVLYVVDNGDVEAYWLAWTYPDVVRPWRDHIVVDAYRPAKTPDDVDELASIIEDGEPVRTIDDFEQGWLSDGHVHEVVRDYHRWVYEMHSMTMQGENGPGSDAPEAGSAVVQTPEYWLDIRSDVTERVVPPAHPFTVPVRIGSPSGSSSQRIRDTAAQTRFSIGAGLNAAETASEADVHRACTDAVLAIVDAHVDQVAAEFIPGLLGDVIEEYQQTRDRQRAQDLWKN